MSSSGATGVDSHYIFELHNAIQDRGPLESLHFLKNANATPPAFTSIDAFVVNVNRDAISVLETPGLVAGRHIWIDDVAGHSTSAGFAADSGSATTISVTAYTDLADARRPAGSTSTSTATSG